MVETLCRFVFLKCEETCVNVNVKYLYCSTQHRERTFFFGYIVLPV